jgi:hypothetical protein
MINTVISNINMPRKVVINVLLNRIWPKTGIFDSTGISDILNGVFEVHLQHADNRPAMTIDNAGISMLIEKPLITWSAFHEIEATA